MDTIPYNLKYTNKNEEFAGFEKIDKKQDF